MEHKGYECYDEVFAVDDEGTQRFSDIVAFSTKGSTALIIYPTVRYETNDQNQWKLVQQEKESIYEKCETYYNSKFSHHYGYRNYEIHGLCFVARGTISNAVLKFYETFDLSIEDLIPICKQIMIDSIQIINNHLCNLKQLKCCIIQY